MSKAADKLRKTNIDWVTPSSSRCSKSFHLQQSCFGDGTTFICRLDEHCRRITISLWGQRIPFLWIALSQSRITVVIVFSNYSQNIWLIVALCLLILRLSVLFLLLRCCDLGLGKHTEADLLLARIRSDMATKQISPTVVHKMLCVVWQHKRFIATHN